MDCTLKNGHKITKLSPEEEKLRTTFEGEGETLKLEPEGWTYLKAFRKYADQFYDFEVVLVCSVTFNNWIGINFKNSY